MMRLIAVLIALLLPARAGDDTRVETGNLVIEKLDLGALKPGANTFRAVVKNTGSRPVLLGVDLRHEPGYCFLNWQEQFPFLIWPNAERTIRAEYNLDRQSPQSTLRVRFMYIAAKPDGTAETQKAFFEKKYAIGAGAAAYFLERETPHLRIFYTPGSKAEADIDAVARDREAALEAVARLLATEVPGKVRLFFFTDLETKKYMTGHQGAGLAGGDRVVEVYNDKLQLNPYHELVHIVAQGLGDPPAMFNEGLAVYLSEKLGSDALRELSSPGQKVDDVARRHRAEGKHLPLAKLLELTDIGPEETRPSVTYPQAASMVKFLISRYGDEKFRAAFKTLVNGRVEANRSAFESLFGSLESVEADWDRALTAAARQ